MPIYKIADLCIKINTFYEPTAVRLEPYLTNDANADFDISITKENILERSIRSDNPCSESEAESLLILSELCKKVLESYNGFFFHSSCLMLDGEAYVFTAASGTGKSTHTALWRRHFGDRVTMINDDKPIIRKKGSDFFIYGTPWMGKADIGNNVKAPVKAVYVLRRGTQNSAVKVSVGEVFKEILEAIAVTNDKGMMSTMLTLLDDFFREIPLYVLTCTISDDAVTAAYNAANNLQSATYQNI